MDTHLDRLYMEYHNLINQYVTIKNRLASVVNGIHAYGGELPSIDQIHEGKIDVNDIIGKVSEELYPKNGTWKIKILFALKRLNKPVTAAEVSEYLRINEKQFNQRDDPRYNIDDIVTVTLSKMGVDKEIGVEVGYRNKYFLKSE